MGTYNGNITFFYSRLAHAVAAFGGATDRLIIGLETVVDDGPNEGKPYTAAELTPRFEALAAAGVTRIGLWDLPVTTAWWPFLSAFNASALAPASQESDWSGTQQATLHRAGQAQLRAERRRRKVAVA